MLQAGAVRSGIVSDVTTRAEQLSLPLRSRARSRARTSWALPASSRTRVDKAGQALATAAATNEDLDVINNWRSSHSFPLNTFQVTLRRKASAIDGRSLVAQRIKRLTSIEEKLRNSNMRLSQMQDIGGCRAVVATVGRVRGLQGSYAKDRASKHQLVDVVDYIATPRDTGYRGVHLIYRYHSDHKGKEPYNRLQIEIQLRSRLQHAWATAVETVDVFTNQALKKNTGDLRWLRFFKLMGSVLARRERCPLVAGTPQDDRELRRAVTDLSNELRVDEVLTSYHVVLEMTRRARAKNSYYLLELRPTSQTAGRIVVTPFMEQDAERATEKYLRAERALAGEPAAQAVLVRVESLNALKRAYPNYFLDTRMFIDALRLATQA